MSEYEKRTAEVEARGRELDRLLAEVRRAKPDDGTVVYPDGIRVRPEIAATAPPLSQAKFESDYRPRYSPVPDGLKTSNQDRMTWERIRRDQKLAMELAAAQADSIGTQSPTYKADAAALAKMVLDNKAMAANSPFTPVIGGKFVQSETEGGMPRIGLVKDYMSERELPPARSIPGFGPGNEVPVTIMHDPDSGRGPKDASLAGPSEIDQLRAEIRELRYQLNAQIKRGQ